MDKDKKNKKKRVGKIAASVVLVLLFLGSCSPSSPSSASASTITDTINNTTRYIDNFIDFYEDRFSEYYNFVTGYKGVWTDKTIADFNRSNLSGSGELKSYPLYSFTGKVINDYFNINNSVDDVEARDVNYIYLSTSTNRSPETGASMSGYSNIVPQEFYSGENVPQIGTFFILRTHVDLSSGEVIEAKRYAFVPLDYMPYIMYYANGNISVLFYGRFNLYVDGVLQSTVFNFSDQSITFYNSSVNSAVYRNGLAFYPDDTQFFNYPANFSRWYITDLSTNNTNFYDDYTRTLNTVYVDTPSAKPPVSLVGLPMGTVITKETVNNYNYITYSEDDNKFKLNTYDFGVDFDANIKPQIQLDFDNVFKSQPLPGLNFDSDILYNYIDIFSLPLSSNYLPSEWLHPFPKIHLQPNLDVELPSIPQYELDSGVIENSVEFFDVGKDFFEASGLLPALMFFAVAGILFLFLD